MSPFTSTSFFAVRTSRIGRNVAFQPLMRHRELVERKQQELRNYRTDSNHTNQTVKYFILLTGCQVLLWNKPIKSRRSQSVQLYTEAGLEISTDFGPENMWQYVANLE